jgi:TfoX/Sxy family transcriptional regulator of competence genes
VRADSTSDVCLINRLAGLGDITSRPLFGGHGVYWRGVIFAIVYGGGST